MQERAKQAWYATIRPLAARNGRIELWRAYDGDESHAPVVYPSRALEVTDGGGLLLEMPDRPGAGEVLRPDSRVDVRAVWGDERWTARCRVLERTHANLNAVARVRAVRVSEPLSVWSGQRREFFRVETAGSEFGPVTLVALAQDDAAGDGPAAASSDSTGQVAAMVLEGTVLNLSGGGVGVGVVAKPALARAVRGGQRFRCRFELPGGEAPLELDARLAQVRSDGRGGVYLGLRFELDEAEREPTQDRIVRVVNEVQRQQLARRRGA